MAKKHLKKCSTSLVIRKIQMKTTLRFHLTLIRMAKINKIKTLRRQQILENENGENRTLFHCWWDCKLEQPLWKSVWQSLRKLDIILPENSVVSLLGKYPKDAPTYNRDICSIIFIAALLQYPEAGKNPHVLQPRNGYRKCGTFIQWSTTHLSKTINS